MKMLSLGKWFEMNQSCFQIVGWVEGLEPSISRATTWRVRPLHYTHHAKTGIKLVAKNIIAKFLNLFHIISIHNNILWLAVYLNKFLTKSL